MRASFAKLCSFLNHNQFAHSDSDELLCAFGEQCGCVAGRNSAGGENGVLVDVDVGAFDCQKEGNGCQMRGRSVAQFDRVQQALQSEIDE